MVADRNSGRRNVGSVIDGGGGRRPIKGESDVDGGINPRDSLTENEGIDCNSHEIH